MRGLAAAVLLVGILSGRATGQDLRNLVGRDTVRWSKWETASIASKQTRLRSLHIGFDAEYRPSEAFHLVDLTGDSVPELVYSGPYARFDSASVLWGGEGDLVQIYEVDHGWAQLVLMMHGRVTELARRSPRGQVWVRVRDEGCCGDDRVFTYELKPYKPNVIGQSVSYLPLQVLLVPLEVEYPREVLARPKAFRLKDPSDLRSKPLTDDQPREDQWGKREGNVLARYAKDANGIAVGQATDERGGVWWFVVMDARTPPLMAVHPDDSKRIGPPAARAGWLKAESLSLPD